jgi:hypothetical protein
LKRLMPTLAAVALLAPASASANQWYIEDGPHGQRARIPAGESVEVPTSGTFNVKIQLTAQRGVTNVKCEVTGAELLSDPSRTEALAETSSLTLYSCGSSVTVVPVLLPWSGGLAGDCQPCTITRGEALEVSVGGVDYGTFTGVLTGKIGDFDEPIKDDIDHIYVLNGKKSGTLTGESGTVLLSGSETFGLKKDHDQADGEPNDAATVERPSARELKEELRSERGLKDDDDR